MTNSFLLQINVVGDSLNSNLNLPVVVPKEETLSIFQLLVQGGWYIMIPLALLSFIAIYIIIERLLTINKAQKEDTNFMNQIRDYIHDGKIESAVNLCRVANNPVSRMIEKGVSRIGKPLNDINTAIENVGKLEVARLEKGLSWLGTIAGAAPMIGFLGTVIGMIRTFHDMSTAGNQVEISN